MTTADVNIASFLTDSKLFWGANAEFMHDTAKTWLGLGPEDWHERHQAYVLKTDTLAKRAAAVPGCAKVHRRYLVYQMDLYRRGMALALTPLQAGKTWEGLASLNGQPLVLAHQPVIFGAMDGLPPCPHCILHRRVWHRAPDGKHTWTNYLWKLGHVLVVRNDDATLANTVICLDCLGEYLAAPALAGYCGALLHPVFTSLERQMRLTEREGKE